LEIEMGFGLAMQFGADIPARLADMATRSVVLAAAALAVIYLLRVRTAAARHAVWTVVSAAMLLLPALGPLLHLFRCVFCARRGASKPWRRRVT
jgi:predicted metal-binding membrane protein